MQLVKAALLCLQKSDWKQDKEKGCLGEYERYERHQGFVIGYDGNASCPGERERLMKKLRERIGLLTACALVLGMTGGTLQAAVYDATGVSGQPASEEEEAFLLPGDSVANTELVIDGEPAEPGLLDDGYTPGWTNRSGRVYEIMVMSEGSDEDSAYEEDFGYDEAGEPVYDEAGNPVYDEEGHARTIHERKLEMLEDLIEAANGQPVLIAYWFKHDRQRILEHLTACGYSPRDIRESADIIDWNAGKIPVALIHPASAGHGLNIQAGGHILIWFGLTWSLELYQQTNARLWRQGQKQTVTVHHIVTKNTVDEDVLAALASKDVTQEKLIAAVKARL